MKKWILPLIMLLCLLPISMAQAASDSTYTPPGASYSLTYSEYPDGTLYITGWSGDAQGELILPDTIDGKPVIMISSGAFNGCSGFTGPLTIPGRVTQIGSNAFNGCSGFTSLSLPEGLTSIDHYAFSKCTGFTGDLVIPDSITYLGSSAFDGCSGFSGNLSIGSGVTELGSSVFEDCSGFTSLSLSEGLTKISGSFKNCTDFTGSLVIPSSVTELGSYAFQGCSGFTGDLVIPEGVTQIGSDAFAGCSGFTSLSLPESLTEIWGGAFRNCTRLTGSLVLHEGLAMISNYAFGGCAGLTGPLTIPDSVTVMESGAFSGCTGFTSLSLGNGLAKLGDTAFENCTGLSGPLVLPEGLTSIGAGAFGGCTGLSDSLVLPASLTSIGAGAFRGCTGLTSLSSGGNLTYVGSAAFKGCTGLSGDLILSGQGMSIGEDAFRGCTGLNGSIILSGVRSLGEYVFEGCTNLSGSLVLGDELVSIDRYAFAGCTGLTGDLILPDTVTEVGNYAFSGCTGFSGDLSIGSGITRVGTRAFENCSGFTGNLTIGGNGTEIEEKAFYSCSGFSGSLTLGNISVIGPNAFEGCSSFTGDLTLSGITSYGASAFSSCGFTGTLRVEGDGTTVLPNSLFYGCGFTGLQLSGVASIGNNTFKNCSSIAGSLVLPEGLTSIGYSAFEGCSGFTGALVLPESLTSIDYNAFKDCSGFTGSLIFPDSLTELGTGVFENCSGFSGSLRLSPNAPVPSYAFSGCSGFTGTLTIPDNVSYVGSYAFNGCSGFTELVFGRGLTEIGSSAFENCSGFTGPLVIPDYITSLGNSAFAHCSGFTSLTLGSGITTIPGSCFYHCDGLKEIVLPETITYIEDYSLHIDEDYNGIPAYFQGSREAWELVDVDKNRNDLLGNLTYDYQPVTPPAEDTRHIGTASDSTADSISIDGVTYPFAEGFTPSAAGYAGKFLLYTLNESGAVTSITVLTPVSGIWEDWTDILSQESRVTISGVDYTFSSLGDRGFLRYERLLTGQQVVFYRDDAFTVYRIEADPKGVISAAGLVTDMTEESVTIDYCTFTLREGLSLNEETYLNQYVRYEVQGLTTLSSLELLPTDSGTLTNFDSAQKMLTINEKTFFLSSMADVDAAQVISMVGEVVSYTHDDSANVYHVELLVPDGSTFVEDTYRAHFLQSPSLYIPSQTVSDLLSKQTPGEIMLEAMEEEGFVLGVAVWDSVTFLADTVCDISNSKNIHVMPKDLFSAIILEALETSTMETTSFSAYQTLNQVIGNVNEWLYLVYRTENVNLKDFSDVERSQLANVVRDSFYKANPDYKYLANVGKVFQYINTSIQLYDSVNECITTVYNNLFLYQMCDSMKEVLRTMYTDACRYGYPLGLQMALAECIQIVNATSDEFFLMETIKDVEIIAGESASKMLLSAFWRDLRTQVEVMYPALAILRASYTGTKLLCDAAFNTDNLSDQFWELLATVQVEHLIETSRATLATRFQYRGTLANAQAYLSATDLLFSSRKLDCGSVLKYVEAADSGFISAILTRFGFHNTDAFKSNVEGIRKGYENGHDTARWGWITYADEAYPDLGLEIIYGAQRDEDRALRKEVQVACPVAVSVYNADGQLVAYASQERITSQDKNVVVSVQGDVKTIFLYNRTDYRITLSGSGSGSMDVAVMEYGDDEQNADRTVSFYNVALTEGSVYDLSGADGSAYTLIKDGEQTVPDLDTQTSPPAVSASVVNGAFAVGGNLLSQVTAPGLQELTVTAMVPDGYTFTGWSGNAQFADASSPSTTVRLPASGTVTLTAELAPETPSSSITLDRSQAVLRPGQQLRLSASSGTAVIWSSLDPHVATVDATGHITAVKCGTTSILAASADGRSTAICTVVVRDYGAVTFTILDGSGHPVNSIPVGTSFTVQADITNGDLAYEDHCLLAGYDANGRLVCFTNEATAVLLPSGAAARLTFSVEACDVPITSLKLFLLSSGQELQPLTEAAAWTC